MGEVAGYLRMDFKFLRITGCGALLEMRVVNHLITNNVNLSVLQKQRSVAASGAKLHGCCFPTCGKVYGKSSHLKAHYRTHTGNTLILLKSQRRKKIELSSSRSDSCTGNSCSHFTYSLLFAEPRGRTLTPKSPPTIGPSFQWRRAAYLDCFCFKTLCFVYFSSVLWMWRGASVCVFLVVVWEAVRPLWRIGPPRPHAHRWEEFRLSALPQAVHAFGSLEVRQPLTITDRAIIRDFSACSLTANTQEGIQTSTRPCSESDDRHRRKRLRSIPVMERLPTSLTRTLSKHTSLWLGFQWFFVTSLSRGLCFGFIVRQTC